MWWNWRLNCSKKVACIGGRPEGWRYDFGMPESTHQCNPADDSIVVVVRSAHAFLFLGNGLLAQWTRSNPGLEADVYRRRSDIGSQFVKHPEWQPAEELRVPLCVTEPSSFGLPSFSPRRKCFHQSRCLS